VNNKMNVTNNVNAAKKMHSKYAMPSKDLHKIAQQLQKAVEYAEQHNGVLQNKTNIALLKACHKLQELLAAETPIAIDLRFYESVSAFIEEVVCLRTFARKCGRVDSELLLKLNDILARCYTIVYGNPVVREACMSSGHIGQKLEKLHTIESTEYLIGALFHKMIVLEKAAESMDDKVDELVVKLKKLQKEDMLDSRSAAKIREEFIDDSFNVCALYTALDFAIEELALVKNHLRQLLEK
jgi:hypothetical protein